MSRALSTAYAGQASVEHSAYIMATVGVKGYGLVKHHGLDVSTHVFISNTFFEVGMYTTATGTPRNDTSVIIQTKSRMYLVSQHMIEGSPLSMMETRITAPITAECALIVHTTLGNYKVVQSGLLTCYKYGSTKKQYTLTAGDSMHLDHRDACNNDCIAIGHSGYHLQYRKMPTLPSVHPPSVLNYWNEDEKSPSPSRGVADHTHQIAHDILASDIRANEDMLMTMGDGADLADGGHILGATGLGLSLLCALAVLFVLIRCARRRATQGRPAPLQLGDMELGARAESVL